MSTRGSRFRYPMWLGLASFAWAIIGWLGAALAPQLAFTPGIEVMHRVLPAITLTLILCNLIYAVFALFWRKVPVGQLLIVTALQLGLFTTLFYQIDAHFEANAYWLDEPTQSWNWVQFSAAHALRASDILDTVEAYDLNIQTIRHRSPIVAALVVLYHVVVDLFMLGLFRAIIESMWRRWLSEPKTKRRVIRLTIVSFVVWLLVWSLCVFYFRPWNATDIPLWLGENIVRVLDFPDLMDSYHIHWHQVPKEPLESTLTFFCRIWIVIGITWLLKRRTSVDEPQPATVLSRWSFVSFVAIPALLIVAVVFVERYARADESRVREALIVDACGADAVRSEHALAAIRRLGPNIPQALERLLACGQSRPDRTVRIIETLGLMGPQAIPALQSLATESHIEAVVNSLVAIGPKAAPALVGIWSQEQFAAVKARIDGELRSMGTDAVRPLIAATTSANAEAQFYWFQQLDRNWHLRDPRGNRAFEVLKERLRIPELIRQLRNRNPDTQRAAAEALGKTGNEAVSVLIETLKDNDSDVRIGASNALGQIGPTAVSALIEALKDNNSDVRIGASYALGQIGPDAKEAVPALIVTLKNRDLMERRRVVEALGKIGPNAKEAVPALTVALKDNDKDLRFLVAHALGKIGPNAKEAVPALIVALKDNDRDVRYLAAEALGKIGPNAKEAVPALIVALKDNDLGVRYLAAEALWKNGAAAVPALLEALEDKDDNVRERITEVLGKIGPDAKAAVPALIAALKDSDSHVRLSALEALRKIGAAAVPALIIILNNDDKNIRKSVAEVLGKIGPDAKAAVPALIAALKDKDNDQRVTTVRALGGIGAEANEVVPTLITALKDEDPYVRRFTAEALGKFGPAAKTAIPVLLQVMANDSDEFVREYAKDALKLIEGK